MLFEVVLEFGVCWVLVWLGLVDEVVCDDVNELCELFVVWCDVKMLV